MELKQSRMPDKQQLVWIGGRICLSILMFLTIPTAFVKAQITPDESLSTNVEQQVENELKINGGEREKNNLFHSFEEFSVPEGIEAVFENALDIENIFTRITGDSASNINGIIRTQGGANFFLINPNGIVFGENAQLDVGGSFIATTADSVQFEDGTEFAASGVDKQPILTVSVPIGLQFDSDSGAIAVNGTGNQITSDTIFSPIDIGNTETGLSITAGKTLALIGGDITFSGGIVTAEGGRIEIGSVNSGLVSLQETDSKLAFGYENVDAYQDISLSQQTLLDASGEGQSEILLTGNNISFSNESFVLNQNRGSVDSGTIAINAFKSLNLSGISSDREVSSSIRSESLGSGQGAKININTRQIIALDQAQIIASSYSKADVNDITINALDSLTLDDSSIIASTFAEGNAGNLKLSTSHFQVKNNGSFTSSTIGTGNGGNININADFIEVVGGFSGDRSNISGADRSNISAS
ncbi:MAG: filamentous hemagglutinin N-terminal domain-containing protein, partial [Waterburya sp.]